ncbi:MAG TPA: FAD-dependent oxidoreductase, partial [Ramlibacter sp.]|nr:FAD-dependent oxidoreductase [Ramlibacter sp.]
MSAKLAIVGAGWAGLAAAVAAVRAGHHVHMFEASRQVGGRARTLSIRLADGQLVSLDNGQHILVGAYRQTLEMMRTVGIDPEQVLLRMPLTLRFPDGSGLALPSWSAPLDAAAGILRAKGWSLRDKLALVHAASRWRRDSFGCPAAASVSDVCAGLTRTVVDELIEPLCVSALNTPAARASGQVFLRVIRDTLFEPGGSNLLLPRCELGALFPDAALQWLGARGASVQLAHRVQQLSPEAGRWLVDGSRFDRVLLACPAAEAAGL